MSVISEIPPVPTPPIHAWRAALDDRELRELTFAGIYAERFAHGTPNHPLYMLIAKLTALLDHYANGQTTKEPTS